MAIVEKIIDEIYRETDRMIWSLARNTHIPGYDTDDLIQEMRIRIWEVIRDNQYDPERCRETSFFYRVCKRHLRGLNRAKVFRYNESPPTSREYRDALDQNPCHFNTEMEQSGYPTNFVENFSEGFVNSYF